jgi:uncharacterized protein YndB with AHSA1/START domain
MHSVQRSRIIHAPKADAWSLLDDFGDVARYHPNVASSRIVNDVERGEGACRECRSDDGGRVEETIVDYDPGEYTVAFTDVGSYPLLSNVVAVNFHAVDDHHTAVTFTARFQPKYGAFRPAARPPGDGVAAREPA